MRYHYKNGLELYSEKYSFLMKKKYKKYVRGELNKPWFLMRSKQSYQEYLNYIAKLFLSKIMIDIV